MAAEKGGSTRREAAFAVTRWIATHERVADMLPEGESRAFVQDLVFTTVRRFRPLRRILGELVAKWPKGELEALLLVGAAQILYMPDVPDFAAVNETVAAAKRCPNSAVARVVNAVLRNLIRRRQEFEEDLLAAPLAERESYPNKLVERWVARYGEEGARKMAEWHNRPAETFLAYAPARRPTEADALGFVPLRRGCRVTAVEGFAAGAFIVQDPATALAVELLDVRRGQRVLDYCAAPGGKTIQIAWRLAAGEGEARGILVAHEVNPKRRRRLEENLARVHLDWVKTVGEGDAVLSERFDRVLVDAPCSNTGVLRRRPEARWRWTPAHLAEITALQAAILEAAARAVAPGGRLVYSTCSNEPEENAERVAAFVAAHPEFSVLESRESVPFESGHDGAFACALARADE